MAKIQAATTTARMRTAMNEQEKRHDTQGLGNMMHAPSETIVAEDTASSGTPGAKLGNRTVEPTAEDTVGDYVLYDTFDGEVAGAGALLIGCAGQLVLFRGEEGPLQQDFASQPGFVADMASGPVATELREIVSPLRTLLPIGEGKFTLRPLAMLDDERKTQARCELWTLTGSGKRRVSLATIQRIRGYDKAFRLLRTHLAENEVEGAAGFGAMAERLFPKKARYTSRPAVEMAPTDSAFSVANALIRAHLGVARQNEAGTIADHDTEFLHDYRVALRKVRSVVSLFKGVYAPEQTEELKLRLGNLMARTGPLRDLDVYLLERDRYLSLVPRSMRPGLDMLFDRFAHDRATEQARLAKHLGSKSYRKEIADLIARFDHPEGLLPGPEADHSVLDYSQGLIWKRYRKVCKIGAGIDDATPDERVHELRIHCKKLRYAMELFAPLFDQKALKRLVKALKKLQETLGDFNDSSVQQEALQGFVNELGGDEDPHDFAMASSVGALITVLHQKQLEERAHVVDKLRGFNSPDTRKGFQTLFHEARPEK